MKKPSSRATLDLFHNELSRKRTQRPIRSGSMNDP
jgi:hypothetical protein